MWGCAGAPVPKFLARNPLTEKQQREQEAIQRFEENRDFAEFNAALNAWEREDLKHCEDTLRALLDRNPEHRDARLLMVDVCLARRQPDEAHQHMRLLLDLYPHDPQVQYAMAILLDVTQRPEEALAYYERARKSAPDNELFAVGYYTAREARQRRGSQGMEQTSAVESGTPLPPPPSLEDNAASANAATGSVHAGGTKALSREAAADPVRRLLQPVYPEVVDSSARAEGADEEGRDPAEVLLQRGREALFNGSPEEALAYFREAISAQPQNPRVAVSAGAAALRANQPELAIELLRPLENRFPDSAALRRVLGAAYYRTGDYHSSQQVLRQALSLDKSSALAYFLMGCTLAKLGQSQSAEAHFRQAQVLDQRYNFRR
jgi:predicted Zn-dependent protease